MWQTLENIHNLSNELSHEELVSESYSEEFEELSESYSEESEELCSSLDVDSVSVDEISLGVDRKIFLIFHRRVVFPITSSDHQTAFGIG